MSQIQAHRRKAYWLFILFALFFSFLYTSIVDGFDELFPFINTSIIGITIGITVAVFELEFFKKIQRRLKFIQVLIIRSVFYILLVSLVIFFELAIARVFKYGLSYKEVLKSDEFNIYLTNEDFIYAIIYTFLIIVLFNFTRQIVKKLGQGVFVNFITGRYVKPVIESKIVMFINIQGSDEIIEKLGRLRFNTFQKEFIYDITESIIVFHGKIYEYVDDQIVVTWDPEKGLHNANCIRAFFEAKNRLEEQKEKYFNNFGIFPKINVALHQGNVVHGEIGFQKSMIVYSGDLMNTTSRILDACDLHHAEILITGQLLNALKIPIIYRYEKCGELIPRGKQKKLEIYTILEKDIEYV